MTTAAALAAELGVSEHEAVIQKGPVTSDGVQTWTASCGSCGCRIGGFTRREAWMWADGHNVAVRRLVPPAAAGTEGESGAGT